MTGPVELVGRDSELARVVACAETVVSSGLGVVVVSGEPGIGKSTLLAEVSRRLAERRWHTCEVVADELHRRTPYSALVEGARSLAGRIDNSWSERLRREAVSALDVFDAGQVDDGGAWFGRAEEAVTRLVTSLAAVGPVAVTVDDADRLDEDSVALLTVLLRRLSTAPVVLLLTARRHPLRPSQVLELMLDRLSAVADVERVTLEPWGSDDVAAGITPALGGAPDQDLADEVHFRSDGNPLLAIEIARSLTEQRLVTVSAHDGTARLAAPVDDLQLSGRDMLLRRLAPLEPSVQAVARAAAVLRRLRVDELGLLARVTGLDEDTAAHAFDALVDAEVLCQVAGSAGSVFAFSHGLVADALYEATGPAERARLHRAAAEQLRDAQAAGLPVDLLQLADHLSASARPGDLAAAQTLTEAADLARTLAPARAAHLSERALELLPTGAPGRALVLSTHCRSLARASRPTDAVVAGLGALAELAPGDTRTRTVTAVVSCLFGAGRLQEALDVVDGEVGRGHLPAVLHAQRALLLVFANRCAEAVAEVERTRQLVEAAHGGVSPSERVVVMSQLGVVTSMLARQDETVTYADEALAAAGTSRTLRIQALAVGACTGALAGLVADATSRLRHADDIRAEVALDATARPVRERLTDGAVPFRGELLVASIAVDWLGGRWDGALEGIGRVASELRDSQTVLLAGATRAIELHVRTWRGELDLAARIASEPPPAPRNMANLYALALSDYLAARGDVESAVKVVDEAVDDPRTAPYSCVLLGRQVDLHLRAGDHDSAAEALTTLEAVGGERVSPWSRSVLHRAAGQVHDDPAALRAAAEVAAQGGLVLEQATSQLALGLLVDDAADELVEAYRTFQALGAHGLRRTAGARLRELGAKVPRGRARGAGVLTGSEERIARLVQQGMRNREIAAALHYSPRSVEVYLSRVYAKLGISSRLELARALDTLDRR